MIQCNEALVAANDDNLTFFPPEKAKHITSKSGKSYSPNLVLVVGATNCGVWEMTGVQIVRELERRRQLYPWVAIL